MQPKRRKSIFDAIIAKWSCTALQDSDNEAAGVLSEDEDSDSSDDYDYEGGRCVLPKYVAKKTPFGFI